MYSHNYAVFLYYDFSSKCTFLYLYPYINMKWLLHINMMHIAIAKDKSPATFQELEGPH